MKTSRFVHIEFYTPINGKSHYYFGTKSAMYQHFSADEIGISYHALRNRGTLIGAPYRNKKCCISEEILIRSEK